MKNEKERERERMSEREKDIKKKYQKVNQKEIKFLHLISFASSNGYKFHNTKPSYRLIFSPYNSRFDSMTI
jgi:hypothetical protein